MPSLTYSRIISLSHPISSKMPHWPGDPPTQFHTVASLESEGYYLRQLAIGEHSGTHLNSPKTFDSEGNGMDAYPVADLVVSAHCVDGRAAAANNPDWQFGISELEQWEKQFGAIAPHSLVVLNTGWHHRWQNPKGFINANRTGVLHFPGFSLKAAQFLMDRRQVCGLGIDTHGIDGGCQTDFAINRLVLRRSGLVLECLANLDVVPPSGSTLAIGVLKLADSSGSPASVFAFLP